MDGILILVVLGLLAIPVSIIVLFVQVAGLKRRLALLESAALAGGTAPMTAPMTAPLSMATPDAALPQTEAPADIPAEPAPEASAPDMVAEAPAEPPRAVTPWDRARAAGAAPSAVKTSPPAAAKRPEKTGPGAFDRLTAWMRKNWVYAISAASLALAGIFFVQYGVEKGLLPPGLRVLAALAFGAGLIGAGEWLRRKHGDEGETPTVNLPSVFSGAGLVTLFAATLAARHLYGLISAEVAFGGHLATAALAVALGWFSGPLLVAVGLIGATAAPFIVGSSAEGFDWLYGYFLVIPSVGLAVDAVRRWAWVSVLALVLGYAGGLLVQLGGGSAEGWLVQLVALALITVILPELRLIPSHAGPALIPALALRDKAQRPRFGVILAMAAMLASSVGAFLLTAESGDTALLAFAGLALLGLAALLWAERAEGLADLALPPVLGFLAGIVAQGLDRGPLFQSFTDQALTLRGPETAPPWTVSLLLAMATLLSLSAAYRALRAGPWGVPFALAAALIAPLAAAGLELLWQPALVLGPYLWALHVIGLAALMTALALRFAKVDAPNMRRAAYATLSALSLIALALFVLTTKTALTLALGVLVVASAALDRRFRLPEMSLFLQVGAAVLGYRLLADPGLDWALSAALGPVVLAFLGTIAAMAAALWLLAPLSRPMANAVAESAALGLTAILGNVLITRWLNRSIEGLEGASAPYQTPALESHWGITLNALPWLIFALMQLHRARIGGPLARLRQALAALGGLLAAFGVGTAAVVANPLFSWGPEDSGALVRGPMLFDTLLLAYGMPAAILLLAAWRLPGLDRRLKLFFLATGAALMALYAGLEIRRFWQGDWLGASGVSQPELYTYTVALMLLGAALLYQAIAKRSDSLRRVAMAVIGLTVAKVFLIDAAGLTGLTRVVSFAGLGLSLAGLAWLNRWAGQVGEKPDDTAKP